MAAKTVQTNFTAGELSPYLAARTDYQKYGNGAERLVNAVVKVSGGAARRAGTQFIAKAKARSAFQASMVQRSAFQVAPPATIRLVPFIFNTQDAYVLEFGGGYIRFYKNRAPLVGNPAPGAAELLTNGTFDSNLSGWTLTQEGGGTAAWAPPGVALLEPGAGLAGLSQTVTGLVAPNYYVVNFTVEGGNATFGVGTSAGVSDLVGERTVTPGQYRAAFKAVGGTAVVQFKVRAPATSVRIDNVSMREADVLELPTPYKAADLRSLRFAQIADVLYIAHQKYPPMKLLRLSDLIWVLQPVVFSPPPTEEVPLKPEATLTPGATSGAGVTFTASAPVFLAADVHRQIRSQGGVAVITAVSSGTQVVADIVQAFPSTDPIGAGAWLLDGSPYSNITLSAREPVNAVVDVTLATAGFRSSDVGGFIHVLDGILEITQVTSSTTARAKILSPASGTTSVAGAWTLEYESWSDALGYPGVVTAHEQRLVFASSMNRPQTFWGSVSGDLENFSRGPNDDDAFTFTLASNEVDVIRWAKSLKKLVLGTVGSEYTAWGGDTGSITPTRILVEPESTWGSDPEPDALRAGPAVLFVQRGRKQIRELAYSIESDSYRAADLTILAEHLFRGGILDMARVSSPDSFLLVVLDDGRMAVATYERAENVVAWSQFWPSGWEAGRAKYRAVCVIPSKCGSGDEVWVAVQRDGVVLIEVFDGQLNTDAALIYDGTTPANTVAGLAHLEGQTVDVLYSPPRFCQRGAFQRNAFQGRVTRHFQTKVSGGAVELPAEATRVEVGLPYVTEIKTLRPEVAAQSGSLQGQVKRPHTLYVRLYCTHGDGVRVQGELLPRSAVEAAPLVDVRKEAHLGWDRAAQTTIRQEKPFPMTVLSVGYTWQATDGDNP